MGDGRPPFVNHRRGEMTDAKCCRFYRLVIMGGEPMVGRARASLAARGMTRVVRLPVI